MIKSHEIATLLSAARNDTLCDESHRYNKCDESHRYNFEFPLWYS